MATTYKVLGQSAPSAASATDLYTVPSLTETIVSTINVANRSSSADTIRISVRPGGTTQANLHYIAYDLSLPGNTVFTWTVGATMDAADVLTVYTTNGYCSFTAFGSEIA